TVEDDESCETVYGLYLILFPKSQVIETVTACDSFLWDYNGQTYFGSGEYEEGFNNEFGCPSTITLDLTIYHSYVDTLYDTICKRDEGYYWSQTDETYYSSTNATAEYTAHGGCDSLYYLYLTVHETYYDTTK